MFEKIIVIDCKNHLLGRLASIIAKELLGGHSSLFLLYLNVHTFADEEEGDRLADDLRLLTRFAPQVQIVLVHENDPSAGGCEFDRFFHVTPPDLVHSGLYKLIAVALYPDDFEPASFFEVMKSMGLSKKRKTQRQSSEQRTKPHRSSRS